MSRFNGKYIRLILMLALGLGCISGYAFAADLFLDDFAGGVPGAQPAPWVDETDINTLDAEIAYDVQVGYAGVTVVVAALSGAVLRPRQNYHVNVFNTLEISIRTVGSGIIQFGVWELNPTYVEYMSPVAISGSGTYSMNIPTQTGYSGFQNMGVVLRIVGANGFALFGSVRIYGPDTPTFTVTETHTPTMTPTITPTLTHSPTITPTPSESATLTITETPTDTFTITPSSTESATLTMTPSITPTPSVSPSGTISPTDTYTLTSTPTATISPTPSESATMTETETPGNTPTFTETSTASPTFTVSASVTPTLTQSPVVSPTFSPTISPTLTASPVVSATSTETPGSTGSEALANIQLMAKIFTPNGTMNQEMVLGFQSNLLANEITVTIFTVSGRKLVTVTPRNVGAGYQARWDGRDDSGREQPAGIYIYHIKAGGSSYRGAVVIAR